MDKWQFFQLADMEWILICHVHWRQFSLLMKKLNRNRQKRLFDCALKSSKLNLITITEILLLFVILLAVKLSAKTFIVLQLIWSTEETICFVKLNICSEIKKTKRKWKWIHHWPGDKIYIFYIKMCYILW